MTGLRVSCKGERGVADCEWIGEALPQCIRNSPSHKAQISLSKTTRSLQLPFHRPCLPRKGSSSSNTYRLTWAFCLCRVLYFPVLEHCACVNMAARGGHKECQREPNTPAPL